MKKVLALVVILVLVPLAAFADSNRIFDNAGLFSETDAIELNAAIKRFQEQTNLDIVILTTDDFLGEFNQKGIADSFYDSQGFGLDSVNSGILFYIDMNQRQQYLSTTGKLIEMLDDKNIEKMLDATNPYLTKGAYKEAAQALIKFLTEIYSAYLENDTSITSTK